jgi:hypothetical protein
MADLIYDVMLKRTHKFSMQVKTDDPLKVPDIAKQMVKDGSVSAVEYDVAFVVRQMVVNPDAIQ